MTANSERILIKSHSRQIFQTVSQNAFENTKTSRNKVIEWRVNCILESNYFKCKFYPTKMISLNRTTVLCSFLIVMLIGRPVGRFRSISAEAGQWPAGPADPKVKILRNTQIRAILIDIIEFNNTQGTKLAQTGLK